MQQTLTFETDKRLAIDTGDPVANWSMEDLVAEKHRLRRILDACPPDRAHDIRSLTARRDQLAADVEALADRYADHSGLSVLSRTKRAEHRDLGKRLGEGTAALGRMTIELRSAQDEAVKSQRFRYEHAPDADRLDAIESELDRVVARRVELRVVDPPDRYLHVLGTVPSGSEALAAWKRGARILEAHIVGIVAKPPGSSRTTVFGSLAEAAEMRARLETLPHRSAALDQRSVDSSLDVDLGL